MIAYQDYLTKLVNDQLDDGENDPITYQTNPFYEISLEKIKNLSFATADNPFIKSQVSKYYPEALVLGGDGQILAHISPKETASG
jgi:hypothetical protein